MAPPRTSIDYRDRVVRLLGENTDRRPSFACSWCPAWPTAAAVKDEDSFDAGALDQWVEQGKAPLGSSRLAAPAARSIARVRCARIRKPQDTRGAATPMTPRTSSVVDQADRIDGSALFHDPLALAAMMRNLAPAPTEAQLRANGVPVLALIGELDPRHSGRLGNGFFPMSKWRLLGLHRML